LLARIGHRHGELSRTTTESVFEIVGDGMP
jgi:hypothetical protein